LAKKMNCRARFLLQKRKLGKENESSRTPRWACLIDAFLKKSFAKNSVEKHPLVFSFFGVVRFCGLPPSVLIRTHPYPSVPIRTPAVAHPGISSSSRRSAVAA